MGDNIDREQRNQEATVHVGNLDSLVTEEILWELFSQAGPLERLHIPRDKVTGEGSGYGFVEFSLERDADYAARLLNGIKLYNRNLRVNKATSTAKALDVGANLFIGQLDEQVDETMLTDVFSAFGTLIKPPHVARDIGTGKSKGYAFLSYDNFRSSDAAISAMNDQFLFNKQIRVMYAYKKGTSEQHGTETERLLAESQSQNHGNGLPPQGYAPSGANLTPIGRPAPLPFAGGMMPPPPPPLAGAYPPMAGGYAAPPPPMAGGYPPPSMTHGMAPPPPLMMAPPPPPPSLLPGGYSNRS